MKCPHTIHTDSNGLVSMRGNSLAAVLTHINFLLKIMAMFSGNFLVTLATGLLTLGAHAQRGLQ